MIPILSLFLEEISTRLNGGGRFNHRTTPEQLPSWPLVLAMVLALLAYLLVRWLTHWPGRRIQLNAVSRASAFSPDLVSLPNKQEHRDNKNMSYDTIVIGSGSGGCACANLLAQAGQKVLVLEQHPDRTGGCTHSFRQENCEWDTGLHYTSMGMSQRTQRPGALLHFMTKGKQAFVRLQDPYDQVLVPSEDHDGSVWKKPADIYDFCAGAEATVDRILEKILQLPHGSSTSRQDMEQLRRHCLIWMQLCTIINDGFTALGISRVLPKCLHGVLGLQKRIDVLYTLAAYTVWDVQYAVFNLGYSIDDLCNSNKKTTCPKAPFDVEPDPVLRRVKAILTHPIGDYAVQPKLATFAAHGITMAHYLDGAAYTVGPTQNISIRSTSVVRKMGGQALVDATVEQIIMEKGRAVGVLVRNTSSASASASAGVEPVKLTEIRARNIVCATSVYNLYNKLLPQDHPVVREFHDPSKRTIRQSNGHVFLFCKIDGDATDLGLPQHNLWYFNSYDMDVAFDKYWANPTGERPPTVYIGFPCTKDPTWKRRLPGVSNCILISDGLWEWFAKWSDNTEVHHRGAEYEAFKEKLTKHLLDILYEAVPQIKGKVSYHTLGTPLSEVTYLSSWHAGSYGTMCLPSMFAPTNHQWTTTPHTKIPGLYLAGSDAFLPAVCGAMYGGCFGAAAVLGHVGTLRLTFAFLTDFANSLREENPKLSVPASYMFAVRKFIHDN